MEIKDIILQAEKGTKIRYGSKIFVKMADEFFCDINSGDVKHIYALDSDKIEILNDNITLCILEKFKVKAVG